MSTEIKAVFAGRHFEMLLVIDTIIRFAIGNQPALMEERTNYTLAYFASLEQRITAAISLVGAGTTRAQLEATGKLILELADTYKRLSIIKTSIEDIFATNPTKRDLYLNLLGYNAIFKDATSRGQERTFALAATFASNLTPDMRADLVAGGVPDIKLTELLNLAISLRDSNVTQEQFKVLRSKLSEDKLIVLNGLYLEVIGVCKLGRKKFTKEPAIKKQFSYSGVLARQKRRPGNDSEAPPTDATPPVA